MFSGFNCRTIPTHGMLMKRASELRDILGLAKCYTLLTRVLEQQPKELAIHHPTTEEVQNLPKFDGTPFALLNGRFLSPLRRS